MKATNIIACFISILTDLYKIMINILFKKTKHLSNYQKIEKARGKRSRETEIEPIKNRKK